MSATSKADTAIIPRLFVATEGRSARDVEEEIGLSMRDAKVTVSPTDATDADFIVVDVANPPVGWSRYVHDRRQKRIDAPLVLYRFVKKGAPPDHRQQALCEEITAHLGKYHRIHATKEELLTTINEHVRNRSPEPAMPDPFAGKNVYVLQALRSEMTGQGRTDG